MRTVTIALFVCLSLHSAMVWAKGPTTRIVIEGDSLATPVAITDPEILEQFNIWNGPGVSTRGPDGIPNPPAYLDPERSDGRFIDWPRGSTIERPGLQRLEVTFHIGVSTMPEEYTVAYAIDPSSRRGYIYLPKGNGLIYHGVEGNWFYASERWDEIMIPIVLDSSRTSKSSPSRSSQQPGP